MHNNFKAIGLSYKNAPLEVRERMAFDEAAIKKLYELLNDFSDISEALILSTCNRTEIYYSASDSQEELLLKLIGIVKQTDQMGEFRNYFNNIESHDQAVQHLFDVSMGLEAQVVGDLQIINQVKGAYQLSADYEMAGPFLHRLLHSIFYTNKRVVQETAFRDGAASVSYATVELISELTVAIAKPKILVIGLGEIGEDVARNLENIDDKEVWISNRTFEKAEALSHELGFNSLPFEKAKEKALEADVIISSVNTTDVLISQSWFKNHDVLSHKYLFDLSVPRSIDPNIEQVNGLLLYNIDNIEAKANVVLDKRLASIPDVKSIVESAIAELENWSKEMEVSPVINKLKNALEEIRKNEIARHLKAFNDKEASLVDTVTKNMMQKIIKLPVLQLKAACKRGEAESLIEVLNNLFDLEQTSDKIQK
ncbi:MAG: glutamyl-tRNA reductase [Reichenbachiella sp.]